MKKSKKLIPILIVIFVFGIYFIGKNVRFENNAFRINHLAGSIDDVKDPNLKACIEATNLTITEITSLDCSSRSIYSLEGIDGLTALKTLIISKNYITDLTPVLGLKDTLERLLVEHNSIKELNLQSMTALKEIRVDYNFITKLSGIPANIDFLHISNNKISGVADFSNYTKLTNLSIGGNKITSLNLPTDDIQYLYLNTTSMKDINNITIDGTPIAKVDGLELKHFHIAGITWDNNVKDLLLANPTLTEIGIANTGFKEGSFFNTNSSKFPNLKKLTLNGNKVENLSVNSLPLEMFSCTSCNLSSLEGVINKDTVKELYLSNNKFSSFYGSQYPALENLNITGNKLVGFSINDSNVNKLVISHNDLLKEGVLTNEASSFDVLNPSKMKFLYLRNTGLTGNIDLSAFTALEELYLDNCIKTYSNNINSITFAGGNNVKMIYVDNNKDFSNINITGNTDPDKVLPSLQILHANFTNYKNVDLTPFPTLHDLSLIGNKGLSIPSDKWGNAATSLYKLKVALTDININNIPELGSLRELSINANRTNIINTDKYQNLRVISGVSEGNVNILTSKTSVDAESVKQAIPSDLVTTPDCEEYYDYYTEVDYRSKTTYPTSTANVHYRARIATMAKPDQYKGITAYDGYYNTNIVKIASDIFTFDDANMIVTVGNATEEEILDGITLPNGAQASIKDGKLVINIGENVIGSYTLSRVDPNAPINNNPINPDTDGKNNSLDPNKDYGTTENPNTGAIVSIIALIVLIAAGIVSYYYMSYKKKNENLIEKI